MMLVIDAYENICRKMLVWIQNFILVEIKETCCPYSLSCLEWRLSSAS